MWDVFISHAAEDKASIARPLAHGLIQVGLSVWYDEFTLSLGDRLRHSIERGLAESKYGIVILSPNFFSKNWTQRELDGLTSLEISTGKKILPIWHNVSRDEVERFSPILADRIAVTTSSGLELVIKEILRVIRPDPQAANAALQEVKSIVSTPTNLTGVVSSRMKLARYQELVGFAKSLQGLNFSGKDADQWAEEHYDFFENHDFERFKRLVQYAKSLTGLNMFGREAGEWALRNMDRMID